MATTDHAPRRSLAAALVAAPALWLAAEALSPAIKADNAAQLDVVAAHPDRWYAYTALLLLGSIAFLPALAGISRLVRATAPRLSAVAVALLGWGMVIACSDVMTQLTMWKAVGDGVDRGQMTALLGRLDESPGVAVVYATGGLGFLVGSVLIAVVIARSGVVPAWSGVGLGVALVLQLAGFIASSVLVIAVSAVLALVAVLPMAKVLAGSAGARSSARDERSSAAALASS